MADEILLNAFDMCCSGHQSFGMWRHPRDRSVEYKTMRYWTDLAQTLERGLFDGLFLADVLGTYDVYGGGPAAALQTGMQIPVNDPFLVVPTMAMATEHLCFGITGTLSYEAPVPFARRMSTLDHLTGGRVGWNIVTGYLQSAAKGVGKGTQPAHDIRYDIAEEYVDVMYRLWEESWRDDAVVLDPDSGVFTDPERVSRITHDGAYLSVDAVHLAEPSPQRTPMLYQAGASPKGRSFAARHAECVFVGGPSTTVVAPIVADIRRLAVEAGRARDDVKIFQMMTVVPGRTDGEAEAKLAEYAQYVQHEGALAALSGWTGIDFSRFSLDETLRSTKVDGVQTVIDVFTTDPGRDWTIREIAEKVGIGGPSVLVVGSPGTVATEMERWVAGTGVDGFNLARVVAPETFADFVDLVVPELQARGLYKTKYNPGTYREKIFGRGAHLSAPHPASRHRAAQPRS